MKPILPDESPGDVIAAQQDGTIVLDDGVTTWNPRRAAGWFWKRLAEHDLLNDSLSGMRWEDLPPGIRSLFARALGI